MASDNISEKYVIQELLDKIERQACELRNKDDVLHRKNMELDALHMIWCSGPCESGVHRWTDGELTKEMAQFIWRYLRRFLEKYNNFRYRQMRENDGPMARFQYRSLLASRIWMAEEEELEKIESIFLSAEKEE